MKRLLAIGVVLAAVVVTALAALPLSAGANSDKRLVLAIHGNFTGDTTASGTFSVDGPVSTSGTADGTFTARPARNNCFALTFEWNFTAPQGGFSFHGTGTSCFASPADERAIADLTFKVTNGTGAYAGIAGKGSATGESDFSDGTFTTVFDARVRGLR
jgi:hypothetical protein